MTGFLSRIFGGKKSEGGGEIFNLVKATTQTLIEKANLELSYDLKEETDSQGQAQVSINFSGGDDELLKEKEGQLIDSFQLFLQRVVQHNFPDDKTNIVVDSNGFREESNAALVDMAEKLKESCLEKGKSVYCRALGPKDRKVVHQHLANDERVRSRSIGEGLFKKIKIYPAKLNNQEDSQHEN
jgi:spoIIIJ-associated protein